MFFNLRLGLGTVWKFENVFGYTTTRFPVMSLWFLYGYTFHIQTIFQKQSIMIYCAVLVAMIQRVKLHTIHPEKLIYLLSFVQNVKTVSRSPSYVSVVIICMYFLISSNQFFCDVFIPKYITFLAFVCHNTPSYRYTHLIFYYT